jgi:hypothetical protein
MILIRRFLAFANENYRLAPEQVAHEMEHVYARGDRLLGYFILGHIVMAAVQGSVFNTWPLRFL